MADAAPELPGVLVVDDEAGLREVLEITFRRHGYAVTGASGKRAALAAIEKRPEPFPLVVTDLVMPDGSGMDVLAAAQQRSRHTQVIIITAHSTVEAAIDAMRQGAYDFLTKPFSPAELAAVAGKALEKSSIIDENERLRGALRQLAPEDPTAAFGSSRPMRQVAQLVAKAASTRTTVLITGESGTGKEVVARALHQLGDRSDGPFCVVNCGALPEALMESELFGHEKGAFTGAVNASTGMFREAQGGTLLLDEVGELPQVLQVKLLRVLQEHRVRPVGGTTEIEVDVRVIAATNRPIDDDVQQGRFRRDLYYRLNVIRIEIPPLRDRPGDVRRLAAPMAERLSAAMGRDAPRFTPEALAALESYSFPGNVRELENIMERAIALVSGTTIDLVDLPAEVTGLDSVHRSDVELAPEGCDLDVSLARVERGLILQALERAEGVRKEAAKLLGISFRSLRYRLDKLGIDPDGSRTSED
ncbi:MAG: sigma-54-dependent Fis family transcriptional regulator [Deltaproteobacteria bacterium]|jgi:two-component system response regulator PilR (NtrC family)|nr:sigma-54-dependent Fis family transcriptional regulator [Deltaproteobacteria bacterium]MBW2537604.1 sigma-54-dependent Fis family transcriptional regulator [Deltaproteobacteria bacterium]